MGSPYTALMWRGFAQKSAVTHQVSLPHCYGGTAGARPKERATVSPLQHVGMAGCLLRYN